MADDDRLDSAAPSNDDRSSLTAPSDDDRSGPRSITVKTLVSLVGRVGWTVWLAGAGLLVATLAGASNVPYALSLGMVAVGFVLQRLADRLGDASVDEPRNP